METPGSETPADSEPDSRGPRPVPLLTLASPPANDVQALPLWTRAFVSLLIAQALFGFADALFVLLPKLLVTHYAAGARDVGIVMGAFGVASLLVIPGIAPLVRRLGSPRAMTLANLLLASSAFAFVFIGGAGAFATALRGLHGIAWSLLFAAGTSLVANVAPAARLGQAIGLVGGANLAMHAIAPALAEPIAAQFGPRVVFVMASAAALAAAWRCSRLTVPAAPDTATLRVGAGSATLRSRAAAVAVLSVGGLASAGVFTFIAPFALEHGIHVVRGFFIAYTMTALAVRLGGAGVTDRLGYQRSALLSACAYGAVVILAGLLGPTHLVLLGALFGAAHGVIFPALMALIIGGVPEGDRTRLLAFANGGINLGVTGVGLLGAVAGRAGYPAMYVGTGAVTIAAAFLLLPRRGRASGAST